MDRIKARLAIEDRGYDTPCSIFTGSLTGAGYGQVNVHSRSDGPRRPGLVHRVVYEHLRGPVPQGFELDHLCRQRDCCEIEHLDVVTHGENMRRSPTTVSGIAARQTHCIHGHEFSEANTYVTSRGHRNCRVCHREREAIRRRAH